MEFASLKNIAPPLILLISANHRTIDYVKIYFYLAVFYTGTTFEVGNFSPLLSTGYFLRKKSIFSKTI